MAAGHPHRSVTPVSHPYPAMPSALWHDKLSTDNRNRSRRSRFGSGPASGLRYVEAAGGDRGARQRIQHVRVGPDVGCPRSCGQGRHCSQRAWRDGGTATMAVANRSDDPDLAHRPARWGRCGAHRHGDGRDAQTVACCLPVLRGRVLTVDGTWRHGTSRSAGQRAAGPCTSRDERRRAQRAARADRDAACWVTAGCRSSAPPRGSHDGSRT